MKFIIITTLLYLLLLLLFQKYGYEILQASPDASYQNGSVERMQYTISQGVKSLLIGVGLDVKFWSYAFIFHACFTYSQCAS